MKKTKNKGNVSSYFEIVLAVVLFFAMLISCGRYVNIKLNGKTSVLVPLSEQDKRIILGSALQDTTVFNDDLLEPVFIGIKADGNMKAADFSDIARNEAKNALYEVVSLVFGGEAKEISFLTEQDADTYVYELKYCDKYILLEFYNELPSTVILPCLQNDYNVNNNINLFMLKQLYFFPDADGWLYAVAVSDDESVTELHPLQKVNFDKVVKSAYNENGFVADFEFSKSYPNTPVLCTSQLVSGYEIIPLAESFGIENNEWIDNLLEVFQFNSSLVKSFVSGDGGEINYVDRQGELTIRLDGCIELNTDDEGGIDLRNYIDNTVVSNSTMSFSNKLIAIKKLINELNISTNSASYCLSDVFYDSETDLLKLYFKYMKDGIFLYNSSYDAVFEIQNSCLKYASFKAVECSRADVEKIVFPQKYVAAAANSEKSGVYLALTECDNDVWYCDWVACFSESEVQK